MKLAYLDRPVSDPNGDGDGTPVVLLHREGMGTVAQHLATIVEMAGAANFSRIVAPYGDYAYYPSGMEVGGGCWYRVLPGFEGTDPISLAKAVVQVGDLLDDLDLRDAALVGWGQGAVVAIGAGLLHGGRARSVAAIDAPPGHLELLPAAFFEQSGFRPPVLLAGLGRDGGEGLSRAEALLRQKEVAVMPWLFEDENREMQDQAVAARIEAWLGEVHDDEEEGAGR